MEEQKNRLNIRIEIQNEKMDVDVSEDEDGEIIEDEQPIQVQQKNRTVFTTGINIFAHEEQKKLQERAIRFALSPEEIHSFTDGDLEELRESLGITEENENVVRFDTVHLLGSKHLTVEDILDYFAKYAPTEVEFIDEESVNIKWLENVTAARAMFYSSRAVNGMPVREQVLVKDFLDVEQVKKPEGQSILLQNREIEMQVEDALLNKKTFKNAADIEEITIPIPPGYWRMGDKHPKAKCLLLRFAFKTDKKPYGVESLAKYYKTLGNSKVQPETRKGGGIFDRNKDLSRSKNPWGSLAKNWDKDAKFRESIPTSGETVEIKNSKLAARLGVKTVSYESENEVEIVEEKTTVKRPKGRSMRMRMYADEEEERIKMKKALQKIKNTSDKLLKEPKDLRTILSTNNNVTKPKDVIDLVREEASIEDLGKKLKNRSRQLVFSLERDPVAEINPLDRKENIRSDIREVLNRKRAREESHEESAYRRRHRSPLKRQATPERRRSPAHRRRTPERTVRYQRTSRRELRSGPSEGERGVKPRSKVAVVIKTQKKPAVASTIWSRVREASDSEDSSSDDDGDEEEVEVTSKSESGSSSDSSEGSDSSTSSDSSEDEQKVQRQVRRAGFEHGNPRLDQRNLLKVTMANDRYKR